MAYNGKDWNKRDRFTAAHLQEPVTALRRLLGTPGAGIGNLYGDGYEWRFSIRVGKIVSAGPNGEADYSDERYWVQELFVDTGTAKTENQITLSPLLPSTIAIPGTPLGSAVASVTVDTIVTVTNLPELAIHSHTLSMGSTVWYFTLVDGQDNPAPHHCMGEGGGTSTTVLRIASAYAGRGWYSASICIPPTPLEWTPIIVSGVDTQTVYTNGAAFSNGDYAKNLSNNTVYHRTGTTWTLAAGHITTSDADVTTDLTTQKTTFLVTGPAAGVIACNLFEATTGNDAGLVSPLAAGELCLGIPWSTQSNGTQVYVITGRYRMIDGSNYMVPLFNAGQWTPSRPKQH